MDMDKAIGKLVMEMAYTKWSSALVKLVNVDSPFH